MPLWQWINSAPPYAEEAKLETEQIQETLSQFKQPIPEGFQKLEPAKKNNWGSTEGLDKLLCERYLFVRENNKPIWLDIPHELMEKTDLPVGKTCPWPFYLKSEVLESEREEVEGAITIENEEEIFLRKPFTVENLEEDVNTLFDKIKGLEKKLKNWTDQFPGQTPEQVKKELDDEKAIKEVRSNVEIYRRVYKKLGTVSDHIGIENRVNKVVRMAENWKANSSKFYEYQKK